MFRIGVRCAVEISPACPPAGIKPPVWMAAVTSSGVFPGGIITNTREIPSSVQVGSALEADDCATTGAAQNSALSATRYTRVDIVIREGAVSSGGERLDP